MNGDDRPEHTDDPERTRVDGEADAEAHLSVLPSVDIGASRPRGPEELELREQDDHPVESMPGDPLDGIPSVPANVTGEVPESQVTDRQGASTTSGEPSGSTETPPASTAP